MGQRQPNSVKDTQDFKTFILDTPRSFFSQNLHSGNSHLIKEKSTSYAMLPPEVAGCRSEALEIEPDADKIHSSRLLCCMNNIIFWPTS